MAAAGGERQAARRCEAVGADARARKRRAERGAEPERREEADASTEGVPRHHQPVAGLARNSSRSRDSSAASRRAAPAIPPWQPSSQRASPAPGSSRSGRRRQPGAADDEDDGARCGRRARGAPARRRATRLGRTFEPRRPLRPHDVGGAEAGGDVERRTVRRVRLEARAVGPERRRAAQRATPCAAARRAQTCSAARAAAAERRMTDASVAYRAARRSSSSGGCCGAEKPPRLAERRRRETRLRPRREARRPTAGVGVEEDQSCASSRNEGKTIAGAGTRRRATLLFTAARRP